MSIGPAVLSTAVSPDCQRWQHGRHTWRHLRDGGFDHRRFAVHRVTGRDVTAARRFVEHHHYAGSWVAQVYTYALTTTAEEYAVAIDGEPPMIAGEWLIGVAALSMPTNQKVLTNVFPRLRPRVEALDIGRLVLTPTPANAETWLLGRVFEDAATLGIRGLTAFADPVARGDVLPGHVGIIYQAHGGRPCGRSTPRRNLWLPRQRVVLSARTLQKIRARESGWRGAVDTLERYGASTLRPGQDSRAWLRDALDAVGAVPYTHPGCFRYAWALGPTKADRRAVQINVPETRRPKPDTDRIILPELAAA